ncbi:gamma-aminobutyric acid type B receptor subunit 1-like isoform X2 [Pomacea canaliculata]|nr:gamma-aminobutyric acid type B receptor subunit 1-like isoform X2 [Pomacea canaliculata]
MARMVTKLYLRSPLKILFLLASAQTISTINESLFLSSPTSPAASTPLSVRQSTSGALTGGSESRLLVLGLFGKTGEYPAGTAFQMAAEMAVEDINKRADMLPGYTIELDTADTKCQSAEGVNEVYKRLYNKSATVLMVLGETCSHVTEITAQVSRKWNLVQITYSALSPTLSNKDVFPWFFRVVAPENVLSFVSVELFVHFNWTNVSVIQQNYQVFTTGVELMKKALEKSNIKLDYTENFDSDPRQAVRSMKNHDARIIYVACYEEQARQASCEAFNIEYYGPHIVWIFPGFYDRKWYLRRDVNCTVDEILQVIDGYFSVTSVNVDINEAMNDTISGWPTSEFDCRFCAHFHRLRQDAWMDDCQCDLHASLSGSNRAPLAYDAMWAVALALNGTLTDLLAEGRGHRLEEFTYENEAMAQLIFHNMKNTSFKGITGNISFSSSGDSMSTIVVRQFQRNSHYENGTFVKIAVYDDCPAEIVWSKETCQSTWSEGCSTAEVGMYNGCPEKMVWIDANIRWRDGKVPYSYKRTNYMWKPLPRQLYIGLSSMAAAGILLSFMFLAFNLICRKVRLIKMSSPNINNLILAGCLLVYCTIGMEDINAEGLRVLCYLRQYFLILGFSLAYGALFAKTWRVYEIMTASVRLKSKVLRDSRLFLTVGALVVVNLGVLVLRTVLDHITVVPVDVGNPIDVGEYAVQEQSLVCRSLYMEQFTAAILSLQALLILFGVFLAWQTRKTSIPELNDSRWIGMCIYNVVVLGSLGIIFTLTTTQPPHVNFLIQSVIVFAATTLTQCFIFVPKLLTYIQYRKVCKNKSGVLGIKTFHITTYTLPPRDQVTRQNTPDRHGSLTSDSGIVHDSVGEWPLNEGRQQASRTQSCPNPVTSDKGVQCQESSNGSWTTDKRSSVGNDPGMSTPGLSPSTIAKPHQKELGTQRQRCRRVSWPSTNDPVRLAYTIQANLFRLDIMHPDASNECIHF